MFKYLILAFSFMAGSAFATIMEQTYPRDNAVCYIEGKRIEILIRGDQRIVDPDEMGMGSHVLYTLSKDFQSLPLSQPETETYRFLKGKDSQCIRAQGFAINNGSFAVLFLKENGPYKEKLVIQLFDSKTRLPKEYISTEFLTDKAIKFKEGFAFVNYPERIDLDMGKVQIEGETFTYQDRLFTTWMSYTQRGFEVLPTESFRALELGQFYPKEADFQTAAGWDPLIKKFTNNTIYFAVNHALKKECILFTQSRRKLTETESWRCHQRI